MDGCLLDGYPSIGNPVQGPNRVEPHSVTRPSEACFKVRPIPCHSSTDLQMIIKAS